MQPATELNTEEPEQKACCGASIEVVQQEMAKALKASKKRCLFMPGRGLFVVAKDLDSLEATLEPVLGKGARKRASGKGKDKGARKDRRGPKGKKGKAGPTKGPRSRRPMTRKQTKGKRKAHYKRGPTRRRSPRR